jgi:hypothetical protein
MSKGSVESRLRDLEKRTAVLEEPQPGEVAYAMRYFSEHGEWPEGTRPQVRDMAGRLMAASDAVMSIV